MKKLKDFKKELANNDIFLYPEYIKNKNSILDKYNDSKITKIGSKALYILLKDGTESLIKFEFSHCFEWDDDYLYIYAPFLRDLNNEEELCFDEWEKVLSEKNIKQEDCYKTPVNYYLYTNFFKSRNMEHLISDEFINKLKYDANSHKIWDYSQPGELFIKIRYSFVER